MGLHDGHRQRAKERYRQVGADALADHELLELALFYAIPRQDTNETAHRLLKRFRSLQGVLQASPEELEQVEYAVHFLYEKLLGVMFWDYSATKMDLNRRVCVPFALVWGPLTALTVRYVHPWVSALARSMPPAVTCAALLVLVADCFLSARVLRRSGDIDLMSLPRLAAALRS